MKKFTPRTGGADHLRQRFLADLGYDRLGSPLFAEVRQQQQRPGKTLLAGIEQLIDEVGLDLDGARQHMQQEQVRKLGLGLKDADDGGLFDPHDLTVGHRGGR